MLAQMPTRTWKFQASRHISMNTPPQGLFVTTQVTETQEGSGNPLAHNYYLFASTTTTHTKKSRVGYKSNTTLSS